MSQRLMRRGALVFAGALVSLGLVAIGTSATATPSSTSTTTTTTGSARTTTTTQPPTTTTTAAAPARPNQPRAVVKRPGAVTFGAPHEVNVADLPSTPATQATPDLGARRRDGSRGPSASQRQRGPSIARTTPKFATNVEHVPGQILQNFGATALAQSSCNCQPPDPNGAVGNGRDVEVDNLSLQVWTRADNANTTLVKRTALRTFLNTSDSLSDPRVFFDNAWHRWVLVVTVIPPSSSSTPALWVAASQSAAPGGLWWVSRGIFTLPSGTLLDFPMVGMDADSIVISANEFDFSGTYTDTFAFAIAKQRIYNGLPWSVPLFAGLDFGTHPAFVEGIPQNQDDPLYLVASEIPYGFDDFAVYTMTDSSRPAATAVSTASFTSATPSAVNLPPQAPQPGDFSTLDTGDGRLAAAPHQLGAKLWFARTIDDSGFATVQYGYIDTGNSLAVTSAVAFAGNTTYDWNPAIAVGPSGHVFLVWASVNPSGSTAQPGPAQVSTYFSGLLPTDAVQLLHGMQLQFGFHTSEFRFGDYASVAIDPGAYLIPNTSTVCAAGKSALLVNESFDSTHHWRDRLARVGYCP